jgi:hypothetical protein
MKRVTFYKSPEAEITPLDHTMLFQCLHGITGTAGIKATAITQQWADQILVPPH